MSAHFKKMFLFAPFLLVGLLLNAAPAVTANPTATPEEPVLTKPVPTPAKAPESNDRLRVHFINVGHGDSCLIQTPGGHAILIDAGYRGVADDVVDYVKKAGVKELDLVIATHPHADHVGGLTKVISSIPVKMVLDSGKAHTSRTYQRFLEAVKARPKIKYALGRAGQVYRYDDVTLSILGPTDPLPRKINDCSIVGRLVYGNVSFMLTGDAEAKAEKAIMRRHSGIRSTVLKVGHHGSKTSTTPTFLRAVMPRVAIISCGTKASGNDPDAEAKLRRRGVKVYRTDVDGTIIVDSDGKDYTVTTLGQSRVRP
jgi:beta-lactamase superfamily II metal-dependent hydrolase